MVDFKTEKREKMVYKDASPLQKINAICSYEGSQLYEAFPEDLQEKFHLGTLPDAEIEATLLRTETEFVSGHHGSDLDDLAEYLPTVSVDEYDKCVNDTLCNSILPQVLDMIGDSTFGELGNDEVLAFQVMAKIQAFRKILS